MDSDGYPGLIIILAAALIKGFYTVCETAVTEIDDRRIKNNDKNVKYKTLCELLEKPSRLVTAFAVNRMLTAVMIAYLAAFTYISPLSDTFMSIFKNNTAAHIVSAVCIMLCTVLLLTVICDGVPKKIAAGCKETEKLACFCAHGRNRMRKVYMNMRKIRRLDRLPVGRFTPVWKTAERLFGKYCQQRKRMPCV